MITFYNTMEKLIDDLMMIGVIYALVMDTFGLILKEDIQNQK